MSSSNQDKLFDQSTSSSQENKSSENGGDKTAINISALLKPPSITNKFMSSESSNPSNTNPKISITIRLSLNWRKD